MNVRVQIVSVNKYVNNRLTVMMFLYREGFYREIPMEHFNRFRVTSLQPCVTRATTDHLQSHLL